MEWFDILAGAGDLVSKLLKTGYDIFQDQRDVNYQKDLQQQIFKREDTAVQRRVADLEAAGLNPALANGSAAGAGSVVSRSASHSIQEPGSALDVIAALNQLKVQREEVKQKQEENQILSFQKKMLQTQHYLQNLQAFSDLGFVIRPYITKDGNFGADVGGQDNYLNGRKYSPGSPLMEIERNLYIQNQLNSAAMLQFDRDFYSKHQIFKNFVQPITGAVLQGGVTAARMYGAFGPK